MMRGLIIGPDESQEAFDKRVQASIPHTTISVFGLKPDWIPVHYSNKSLAPWEGGCAWIHEGKVALQLRKVLEKRESYLGLVSKEELLQHEAVHAMRVAFEEPRFEEVLAYQTSRSRFRRSFGPFFRSPRESVLFLSCMLLFPLTVPFPFLQLPFAALLAGITTYGLFRLTRTQSIFGRAKRNLSKLTENPRALMLHLTDKEIESFAKSEPVQIRAFAEKKISLRWQQIKALIKMS